MSDNGTVTLEQVQNAWGDLLDTIRPMNLSLEALLRSCRPVEFDSDTVIVMFDYVFHRDKTDEHPDKAYIEETLSNILGCNCKIRCIVSDRPENQKSYQDRAKKIASISWRVIDESSAQEHLATERMLESPIEEKFWNALKLEHFITPQKKIGRYRVDFAIEHLRIAIELDGHDYHSSKEQLAHDAKRERYLQARGWRIVRFTGSEVWKDADKCVRELIEIVKATK